MNSQLQTDRSVVPIEVSGWLLMLCLILTFVYPATSLYHIFSHTIPTIITIRALNRIFLLSVYSLTFSAVAVFSFVAGVRLWLVKPNAVGFAKRYLVTNLIAHAAYFAFWIAVIRPTSQVAYAAMGWRNVVGPIAFVALWYSYLEHSKRVRATYPTP
jgi:Protein of unknown function (DUF2569)